MILQKDKGSYGFLRNEIKMSRYNCYYCNESINVEDLLKIDGKLKRMDPENQEFLLDNLPSSNYPRNSPFIHKSDLGYDVLNVCRKCFENAKNK